MNDKKQFDPQRMKEQLEFIRTLEPQFIAAIAEGRVTVEQLMQTQTIISTVTDVFRSEISKRDELIGQLAGRIGLLEAMLTSEVERG